MDKKAPFHLCFLNWSPWSPIKLVEYTVRTELFGVIAGEPRIISQREQNRHCTVCNREQTRISV
jgi:hypothetical protein